MLGKLNEGATTQLAEFVDRQCDTNSKREAGADCRIWRHHDDPDRREWLDENFYELALRPFEPRWQLVSVMGNRVPSEDISQGSGNGWHRDSNSPQYKIMILLSDVSSEVDGAFAFVPRSHRLRYVLQTFDRGARWRTSRTRWSDIEVSTLSPKASIITGRAGDIFAFNGALIHRGLPNHGPSARRALTFYLYPRGKAPPHILAEAVERRSI